MNISINFTVDGILLEQLESDNSVESEVAVDNIASLARTRAQKQARDYVADRKEKAVKPKKKSNGNKTENN